MFRIDHRVALGAFHPELNLRSVAALASGVVTSGVLFSIGFLGAPDHFPDARFAAASALHADAAGGVPGPLASAVEVASE